MKVETIEQMDLTKDNYIVQANDLINGKQELCLNAAKLIRMAIMQIKPTDTELKPYIVSIKDLSRFFDIAPNNLYRDIDDITDDIIRNPVFIRSVSKNREKWLKIPWVTICKYDSEHGLSVRLNDELKPFLLELRKHYTQYTIENILTMRSVYGIRLFELIQGKIKDKVLPKEGTDIELSLKEIRDSCSLGEKYKVFYNLKQRVVEMGLKEINRVTMYDVSIKNYIKQSKKVTGFIIHVNMKYH